MMPKSGDKVIVKTEDALVEGILMPRPKILEADVTVIKLDNGYNIGIDNSKIKEIRLKEAYVQKKADMRKLDVRADLPTVSIISCGGTISSRVDYRSGGVSADYSAEDFVAMLPELQDAANIVAHPLMNIMSEDMGWQEWKKMAKAAAKELNLGASGVVLTQGTDTLHFSSAALSFMLHNVTKPVVFTASQRSIDRGSSDAYQNLMCAVQTAARSDIAGVMTCLHGTTNDDFCLLINGTKVRKMHTSRRDAFRPVNALPLAKVFEDGRFEVINDGYRKRSEGKAEVDDKFDENVAMVYVYPGMDPGVIDYHIDSGTKGLVIAATALGHVPTESKKSLLPCIKRAIDKGIPVVIASQTLYGHVHPLVYANLRALSIKLGCIFAQDMLPEVAYIKLGWILGHTLDMQEIKERMLHNYVGELNPRETPDLFRY